MSVQDKVIGKVKQAVGDLTGKQELQREGELEEEKGEAKEDLHRAEDIAQEKAAAVADLERRT
jgi:uncharacterized protein YjbJ (UPF0337 family)